MFYKLVTVLSRSQKQAIFTLIDMAMIPLAMLMAIALRAELTADQATVTAFLPVIGILAVCGAVLGWRLGLTRSRLNGYEMQGVVRTAIYAAALGGIGLTADRLLGLGRPVGLYVLFGSMLSVVSVSWRLALREVIAHIYRSGSDRVRVMIYGAGLTGQQLAAALRHGNGIQPVAFVDDNPTLHGLNISGLRVYAASQLQTLVEEKKIDRVVLAMPSISRPALARIAYRLRGLGCEVHSLPSFAQLVGQGELRQQVTPVSIQDLLGRTQLEKELPGVTDAYAGRRILVSGAGGSIGSELCRQLIACAPETVVLVDHSELALYNIDKELRDLGADMPVIPVLGSVMDDRLMRSVMTENRIDVVLHAAAYKHLPMVEANALAGLSNNVLGTKLLAEAARDAGVERFILVSTDKAVRPTNVMGASKRLAELVVQDLAARSTGTRYSMVRFGNVLGSSGSVIPLFEEQIARGGPVTLTDPNVTRYFMTISEAARLVLLAGSFARGGDVFVLDMGEPVPIAKLARQMIEGAGFSVRDEENPEGDIEIQVTGLRPGEKLHEELLISSDMLTTPHQKILRAQEKALSEFEIATAIKDLRAAIESRDEAAARAVISRWVEGAQATEAARGQ